MGFEEGNLFGGGEGGRIGCCLCWLKKNRQNFKEICTQNHAGKYFCSTKINILGAEGESNPRPLTPEARIMPLDHQPPCGSISF